MNRGDERYSGSWSFAAADGTEYAIVGAKTGTAVYPIDDPDNIVEVGFVPGPATNWREITVIGDYAFVVTDVMDSGHSMQVIDLSYLPDSVSLVKSYTETFTKGHIIQKDILSDEPYVYVMGTCNSCGVHILDVSDPENPVEVGYYDPGYYIHDAHIRGDLMYAAAFYEFEMDIVDISDKSNPVLIGKIAYDGKNTHSSSLSEDGKYLIMADEADGYPSTIFNVEDPENPVQVAEYSANLESLVHNPYVRGDFCFVSHNTEGLRVLDIADPELPVEVGYFDTYDGPSGGFKGLWSACPYFPSGKIIGGDRHEGLYIWTFNDTRAARVYGVVRDSISGDSLVGATILVPEISLSLQSDFDGNFKNGMLEGSYTLTASGYLPKTFELSLSQGDSVWVEFDLVPENFTSSFEALDKTPKLQTYPNPSSGSFWVALSELENTSELVILNQLGQTVFSKNISGNENVQVEANLPQGSYFLKILDVGGNLIGRANAIVQ